MDARTTVNTTEEQLEHCKNIGGGNASDGVRKAVDFHNEFYPLIETLLNAKKFLDEGVLNLGEYQVIYEREADKFFNNIIKKEVINGVSSIKGKC